MNHHVTAMLGALAGALALVAASSVQAEGFGAFFSLPTPNVQDGRPREAAIPRETVPYTGPYSPGTILVSTAERRLYLVLPDHQAMKYGVGVGRPGFEW